MKTKRNVPALGLRFQTETFENAVQSELIGEGRHLTENGVIRKRHNSSDRPGAKNKANELSNEWRRLRFRSRPSSRNRGNGNASTSSKNRVI